MFTLENGLLQTVLTRLDQWVEIYRPIYDQGQIIQFEAVYHNHTTPRLTPFNAEHPLFSGLHQVVLHDHEHRQTVIEGEHTFELRAYCIEDHLVVIWQDISDRVALQARQAHLERAFEHANIGTWEIELPTQAVYTSPSADLIFGLDPMRPEKRVEDYLLRVHGDDLDQVQTAINDTVIAGKEHYVEYRIVQNDGEVCWVASRGELLSDSKGQPYKLVGAFTDITQRKEVELQLQRGRQHLQNVIDNLYTFVGLATVDGILLEANRAALEVIGAKPEDVLHQRLEDTYWFSYSPESQARIREAIVHAQQGHHVRFETDVRVKDEQFLTIDFSLAPTYNEHGQITYLVPSGIDITERKRTEIALRQSEQLAKQRLNEIEWLYESAPIGLCMLDGELRWQRINRYLAEINGFPIEAHLGKRVDELLPGLADAVIPMLQRILETGEAMTQVEVVGATPSQPGVIRTWVEQFLPVNDEHGRRIGISVVAEEVTERKRQERALRESEERYRTLFESMDQGFALVQMIFDSAQTPIDYRFLELNPQFERLTGLSVESVLSGQTIRQIIPDLEEIWYQIYGQVALESIRFIQESPALGRWFDVYAMRVGKPEDHRVGILFTDITESKRQEQLIRESERLARERLNEIEAIYNNTPVGLCVLDHDLRWIRINKRLAQINGFPIEAHLGRNVRELLPHLADQIEPPMRQILATGEPVLDLEVIEPTDGEDRIWSANWMPLRDDDGRVIGINVFAEDVTERRKIELEIRQLNSDLDLRVRQRTAELNMLYQEMEAFSVSVSHDLRAPLRRIDGFCQILEQDFQAQLDPQAQYYLNRIRASIQRMDHLITDLFALSKVTQSNLTIGEVDLSAIVREIAENLRSGQPERRVDWVIESDLRVQGDARLLRIVLENLIGNAWKYTSKREHARIEFGVRVEGEQRVYFVRDNGVGFNMQYADKLFIPFKRLHKEGEFEGTGIGLATTQRIIQRHHGKIWAEAVPDQGATISFNLAPKLN